MDPSMEAKKLAAQPYTVQVNKDLTTTGNLVYLAFCPELEGCMGQGETEQEAIADLKAARIDFIRSLLEDGLPVPVPQFRPTITTSGLTNIFTNIRDFTLLTSKFDAVEPDPVASKVYHLFGASIGS